MPLISSPSDKARSANIATEIRTGKDPKQAEAIGYAKQREAKAKEAHHKNEHEHHLKLSEAMLQSTKLKIRPGSFVD